MLAVHPLNIQACHRQFLKISLCAIMTHCQMFPSVEDLDDRTYDVIHTRHERRDNKIDCTLAKEIEYNHVKQ